MSKVIHKQLLKISKGHCRPLEAIIKSNGVIRIDIPENLELFDCLAQTVAEQQLSYKAAKKIWSKVKSSSRKRKLRLIDYFDSEYINSIRKDGLSKNKIKAIIGAKKAVIDQKITLDKLSAMDNEECRQCITSLWGFGDWSAEMIAIFYLGRTNIWSKKDLILNRGINEICAESDITPDQLLKLIDPYQSYLALHIWRNKD
jgi:DNA-3-methyladenine glycosylase II